MKKLFLTTLSILLMLGMMFTLASCGDDSGDPGNNGTPGNTDTPGENTAPTKIYFLKDGQSAYKIAYSSDLHESYALLLSMSFSDLGCDVDLYEYTDDTAEKEVVIGETDRQISIDLKAAADAIKTADNDFVWAYGYKDGKLGFYANSSMALQLGWQAFTEAVIKDSTVECMSNLWVTGIKTYQEYQDELNAEIEAQDKITIGKIMANLAKFNTSYTSKWGTSIKAFPTSYNASIKPRADHPRVLVNKDSLDDIIANLTCTENLKTYNSILSVANAALSETGGLSGTGTNFSGAALEKIEALAFMYLVTGSEKYGYGAILHSFNLIDTLNFANNSYNNSGNAGSAMLILSEAYDWCYDLFTPEQRNSFIIGTCENIAKYFENGSGYGYPPNDTAGGMTGHSSETTFLRNWLAFGIAVYNERPEIYNYIAGKILEDFVPAANFFYASGVQHQGSAYGTSPRLYSNIMSSLLMKTATGQDIYTADLGAVIMTHLNRIRPDNSALRIGDDFNRGGTVYNANNGLMQLAFYAGSVYENSVAKAWFTDSGLAMSYNRGHMEITPVIFLIYNDPTVTTGNKYDLELVHYNPSPSGSVVARSAWGDTNAWMTYTNIKVAYAGNHDHRDAGTFQIYYKGILAPDTGAYQYGDDQLYGHYFDKTYVKQTVSKNGLLIYNPSVNSNWGYSGGQSLQQMSGNGDFSYNNLEEWQSKISINQSAVLGYSSKVENGELVYTYISGDITKAYDASTVELVVRSTMTLATGDEKHPMAFIVYDRIISDSASFDKSFVLHTTNKPVFGNDPSLVGKEITSSSTTSKNWEGFYEVTGTNTFYYDNTLGPDGAFAQDDKNDNYNGQLTLQTLLPKNPVYRYVGGDGKRFWLNGNNAGTEYTSDYPIAEVGWGRVEIVPSTQNTDDSFLNVMYVGDAGVSITEQAQLIEGTTHDGVVTYGSCVMFARAKKTALTYGYDATKTERENAIGNVLISGTVSFDTTGAAQSELDYYVTGLRAGTWTVNVGGVEKTVEVTKDGAIAVFRAPAGQLTMTRAQ